MRDFAAASTERSSECFLLGHSRHLMRRKDMSGVDVKPTTALKVACHTCRVSVMKK